MNTPDEVIFKAHEYLRERKPGHVVRTQRILTNYVLNKEAANKSSDETKRVIINDLSYAIATNNKSLMRDVRDRLKGLNITV